MITTLFQQLPHIYQSFLPDIFNQHIPVEQYADCSNCNMCKPTTIVEDQRFFSPVTKCCTFKPIVPNYLVGGILIDSKKPTKIHTYVDIGEKITPLGYFPSTKELQDYAAIIPDKFGMDDRVQCELLDDGNCSIWQHRNSICSTYFCHYFKGFHGKQFWEDVRDFLQFVEETLSAYCCMMLDIPVHYLKQSTTNFFINVQEATQHNGRISKLTDADMWGPWETKRDSFFKECHKICSNLTTNDVMSLNPTTYQVKISALEDSLKTMQTPLIPPTLLFNPNCKIIDFDETQTFFYVDRLIKLPAILQHIVKLFDGKTTNQQIISTASQSYDVDMDNHYILHLYQQNILILPTSE
tara:strand:- start:3016 stop:4074 length:1059 start_codon:yes stop_codon:yes gene_type:complete